MNYKIDEGHRKVYDEILQHVTYLSEEHEPEVIAGSLMAIAQRLYRTHLSDEDYEHIMNVAITTEVEPYNVKKVRIH